MANLQRLKMEISNITYTEEQLTIFLQENCLTAIEEYNSSSNTNKKNVLKNCFIYP
jgi:hypothetical protein